LGKVVPLHIPIIFRVNDKFGDLVVLNRLVRVILVMGLVSLVTLKYLLDHVAAHARHHANYFLLFANCVPETLCSINLVLLFILVGQQLLEKFLLMLSMMLICLKCLLFVVVSIFLMETIDNSVE
jgi:hypothetical protein